MPGLIRKPGEVLCTNEFLAGTPVELIMKIGRHKNVKGFYKYI